MLNPQGDRSPPSGLSVLPGVIDKNERTIIGHGLLDYILIKNGSLIAIQNMTFGGAQVRYLLLLLLHLLLHTMLIYYVLTCHN